MYRTKERVAMECRRVPLLLSCFFISACLYAQKQGERRPDSLPAARSATRLDSTKVKIHNLSSFFFNTLDPDKGPQYAGLPLEDRENNAKALEYCLKALKIYERAGDTYNYARTLGNIGNLYLKDGRLQEAEHYLKDALQRELAIAAPGLYQFAFLGLSNVCEKKSDFKKALEYFRNYIKIRDSINNEEAEKSTYRLQLNYELSKREDSLIAVSEKEHLRIQKEIQLAALKAKYDRKQALAKTEKEKQLLAFEDELKKQQINTAFLRQQAAADEQHKKEILLAKAEDEKKQALAAASLKREKLVVGSAIAGAGLMLVIAVLSFRAYRQRRAGNHIISREKERSEALLRNILPDEVAAELKEGATTIAHRHDEVTILISDFVNFTQIGEQLSAQALVKELHECFSAFDRIIAKAGLEKIKTIGDAYMAVGGLPKADPAHASKAVIAALEIRDFIEGRKKNERTFEIRIGVHSGPVVAGIVGVKKFAYDIWGDTVNTAAEMEQYGAPAKVNISQSTFGKVKHEYACEPREPIKGSQLNMYFVEAHNKKAFIAASLSQVIASSQSETLS
jgi:class 3 adenylate cyclase